MLALLETRLALLWAATEGSTALKTLTAQVYNTLANPIGDPVTIVSDGHSWDRLQIPAPSSVGTYYIRVSAGFLSQSLPYSVN
jgi:hypothetical protein